MKFEVKEVDNDECGKTIYEENGYIIERMPNGNIAIYRNDVLKLKRLKRN